MFLSPTGAVLNLGRTVRTVTPNQRRALTARDKGCVIPGCTAPLNATEAHHLRFWRNGGPTDLNNLAMVCGRHHPAIHTGIWSLTMLEGLPWVIPPWIDPEQHPVRNQLRHARDQATRRSQQLRLTLNPPDPPTHPDG